MNIFAALIFASVHHASAPLSAACSGPPRFCEVQADFEEAEVSLDQVFARAKLAAEAERQAFAEWVKEGNTSTFDADELGALLKAQEAWHASMQANCILVAARYRRSGMSTTPHTEYIRCKSERMREREQFLRNRFDLAEAG